MKVRRRALAAVVLVVACGTTMSGATYTASSTNPNSVFTTAADFLVRVTMNDPGPALRGTVALTATASDSGGATIASVRIQRSPAGAATWTDVCTDTVSPYSCSLNTTALSDGFYDFRAIATNSLGQVRQSETVASRQVDNSVPSVTMVDPGTWIPASTTLTSTSSDNAGGTGVASVRYEYTPTGGSTWTTACTGSTAPFSCTFNTTALTDGAGYDLRAVATDVAGNPTTSATIVNRRVDRTPPAASLTAPAAVLTGTVTVAGTASDTGGSGLPSVRFQYSPAGAGAWTDICIDTTSPYSCPFATSGVTDGLYDVRLLAVDGAGNATASVSTNRRVDNNAPTTTLGDPGAYIRGTVTLTASVADGTGSGVTSVAFERRATGTATWASACTTDTTAPYTCTINTTSLANGSWDFRATATDGAGLTGTATVVSVVDNTLPTATMNDPGAILSGSVTLTAGATDTGSGVANVLIEVRPAAGAWSPVCTDTSSPYSCVLATTTLTDGLYELRATATDRAGNATVSTAVVNRRVDNNAPTVTLTDPGAWIRGTKTLTATASDGTGAGVTSVTIQYAPTGTSTWTTVCSDTTSPYSCSLTTTTLPDGAGYDFRAVAADGAGFSTTTPLAVNRRVDNSVPTGVVMTDPGSPLTGTVTFSGTASDAWSGVAEVEFQYFNGLWWSELCTATTEPYSCDANTASVADGLRSVRAVATDRAGNITTSASITNRRFDNNDPTVTMTDPGANLGATVTLGATASDGNGTGVVSVTIQRTAAGAGSWSDVCTDTTSPYSCSFDTTGTADGLYDFRAIAVDGVARTKTSTAVANRRIDNTDPTTTVADPGASLSGSVALTAAADDGGGSGIASVAVQYSPAGAGTWSDVCTDTTSPYSCSWDTTGVSDGLYDLRSSATDAAGNVATSTPVTGRSVDNPAGALDVQTANGGATPGLAEAGDSITFTYNEPMSPASIVAGWNGSGSQTVTVRFVNNASDDRLLVYNAANTTLLSLTGANGVTMGANYVGGGGATVSGTLVTSGASFTVTLGGAVGTATANATMIWNPSAGALSLGGQASTTTARTESGGADAEF